MEQGTGNRVQGTGMAGDRLARHCEEARTREGSTWQSVPLCEREYSVGSAMRRPPGCLSGRPKSVGGRFSVSQKTLSEGPSQRH